VRLADLPLVAAEVNVATLMLIGLRYLEGHHLSAI